MKLNRKAKILFFVTGAGVVAAIIYSFWHSNTLNNFSCAASLSQNYATDNVDVSLSYTVRGTSGIISINGRSQAHPDNASRCIKKMTFILLRQKAILNFRTIM